MERRYVLILLMALSTVFAMTSQVNAEETITVTSTGEDISENLDLKAVASLFGEVADLEKFEAELNSQDRHINNLDLNGDGQVDYLRVVEMNENDGHLIIIQAVLATDIYQDVASIYVDKDAVTNTVSVQVVGDEYLYGTNYVIEPVYIYRPIIYDWFWGPSWVCWHSPYYWGYYPHWWHCYDVWTYPVYISHLHVYHHNHGRCAFRYAAAPRADVGRMMASERGREISQRDMAVRQADRAFQTRNAGMTNARQIQTTQRRAASGATMASRSAQRGSSFTRSTSAPTATRSTSAPTATRSTTATATRSTASSGYSGRSGYSVGSSSTAAPTVTRSTTATATRSTTATATRSTAAPTATRSTASSGYSGRSGYSVGSSSASRSSYSGSASRSSYTSSPSSSRSSYSGGGSRR